MIDLQPNAALTICGAICNAIATKGRRVLEIQVHPRAWLELRACPEVSGIAVGDADGFLADIPIVLKASLQQPVNLVLAGQP